MSAVGAVFMRNGAPAEDWVSGMSSALQGFGDKTVVSRDGPVGLVRVLSAPFTPEDAFDRGIVECRGGRQVAFHGTLHYRDDLIRALDMEPGQARCMADADLFARAWERWGKEAAVHAEGNFVVVVWDAARRVLTALCSPISSPPLYFSVTPRRAVVASAPRGVHAGSGIPRRLDDARLASSLILDNRDLRSTYFQGIQALGCGELLVVGDSTHSVHRFWDTADRVRPIRMRSTEEYVEAGREILRAAVAEAMRACETPAMLLSSGLDSTAVAVNALDLLADRPGGAPLISFTARPAKGWDGRCAAARKGDEGPLVRAMASMYPALDAHFVRAQDVSFDHMWRPMMELVELPQRNFLNLYWGHECRRLARAAGRRVVMNGASGNWTISYRGVERLASLVRRFRWAALRTEVAHLPPGRAKSHFIKHSAVVPFLPRPLYMALKRRRDTAGWRSHSVVHPRFAHDMRVDQRARVHGFDPYYRTARSRLRGQLRALSYMDGDVRSMALALDALHDISLRDPLGDRRLVLWCLGLPDELYWRDGQGRRLARLLIEGRVPDEILHARRRGRQAADWHFRLTQALPRIRGEIEEWRSDPEVAERLDLDRLLRLLDTWPSETPLSRRDHPEWAIAESGLTRALSVGRFIRFVNGSG